MSVVRKDVRVYAKLALLFAGILVLSACGSDGSDEDAVSYVRFYNASYDAPNIFLTIDEDIDLDDDDEFERTFTSVAYRSIGSNISLEPQDYFFELAWQDEESSLRTDLNIIFEDQINAQQDVTQFIVISESIQNPLVNVYSIPLIDDEQSEQDQEDDVFNLRVLNLHTDITNIDVYLSNSDETFNEAVLLDSLVSNVLSDNFRLDEDQYKVYITEAGNTDVLFTSDEINYAIGGQYLITVRENYSNLGSPFVIDNISSTRVTQYSALESNARISFYNGLDENELLPDYLGEVDAQINGVTNIPDLSALAYGDFSQAYDVESGDYRFTLYNSANNTALLQNRVLSLPQNANRSMFLYWSEEAVDDDGDGDIDENGDGIVDEFRAVVSTILVDNSERARLYDKELVMLNLASSDEFSLVRFYFVKSDEIIDTASNTRTVVNGLSNSVILLNNTYQVFAIATIDNNDIILDEFSLTLSEDSDDLFVILEPSIVNSSGYALRTVSQSDRESISLIE